jgi:hypothetical protein
MTQGEGDPKITRTFPLRVQALPERLRALKVAHADDFLPNGLDPLKTKLKADLLKSGGAGPTDVN